MITCPVSTPPSERFHLFGMGPSRPKLIYQRGRLIEARSGALLQSFETAEEWYEPWEYRVRLRTVGGERVAIHEDETGLWVQTDDRQPTCLDSHSIPALPRFDGHFHGPLLRALHGELLTNIAESNRGGGPLPNLLVYDKPWLRDAAMVGLCLERTGNIALLTDWVASLAAMDEPFDRNNGGHREPDNLGQLLTLIALAGGDQDHPLIPKIHTAARESCQDGHLTGLSDFSEHPVYQTKWLKYGLRRLHLDDSECVIPAVFDSYGALFWMDYRDQHIRGKGFGERDMDNYPYLGWAEAHFHDRLPGPVPDPASFPLTWEAQASQANYLPMDGLSPTLATVRVCTPHTWHAAEMFLALLDLS